MVFNLYQSNTGDPVWPETWDDPNKVQVTNGLFNVLLGSVNANILAAVFRQNDDLYRGVTIQSDAEMSSRQRMASAGYALNIVPSGGIIMWSGTLSQIPAGWALCDGTKGTPDFHDRFICSVDVGQNPGITGGANSYSRTVAQLPNHTHTGTTASSGSHVHNFSRDANKYGMSGSINTAYPSWTSIPSNIPPAGDHTHTFTTDATGSGASIDNRPLYYKLAFIIKNRRSPI